MNKTLTIISGIVLVLVVAGASFYGGMVYGKNQAAASAATGPMNFPQGFQPGDGAPPFGGRGQGGTGGAFGAAAGNVADGMTFGEIESIDGNTLTLLTQAGGTVTIQVTDTTLIEKNASVDVTDLATGDTVIVSGSDNDDGSITARSVQVAPAGRFMPNPGGARSDQ